MVAVLLCLLAGQAPAQTVVPQNDAENNCFARDKDNAKLPVGSRIQLITGNTVVPPEDNGDPGATNTLLELSTLPEAGSYCFSGNTAVGNKVFLRVWNTAAWPPPAGTYYGNTAGLWTVREKTPVDDWLVSENINTNRQNAVTSSISPDRRGQGAQSQVITIYGNYFQNGATVAFSKVGGGGTGLSPLSQTCSFISSTEVRATISLNRASSGSPATTGDWNVTVTNLSAKPSNPQTFTVIAGPHPTSITPNSRYLGDNGVSELIAGTGFQGNVQVVFSDNGDNKITFTKSNSDTLITLDPFAIYPSDTPNSPRTVTLTNPDDAGVDSINFTVNDPSISVINPNAGYRGNVFMVTATGLGTHFVQDVTTVTPVNEPQYLKIGPVTRNSATSLTFPLTISPEAAATPTSHTFRIDTLAVYAGETESRTSPNFTVNAPTLGGLSAPNIYRGDISPEAVVGVGTHFTASTPTISFDGTTGVTAENISVSDDTHLSFTIKARTDASPIDSLRTFHVRTTNVQGGTEDVSNNNLTLKQPALANPSPSSGDQGATLNVSLASCTGTHFSQGNTQVSFGSGITVNSVTVNSAISLTANITIASGADAGGRTVTVTSDLGTRGTETLTNTNFTVTAPNVPGLVKDLQVLADPVSGSITLKWTNPPEDFYTGSRIVYTNALNLWEALTTDSPLRYEIPGTASGSSEQWLQDLSTTDVYYFKIFSYRGTVDKFFGPAVKVAAVAMKPGGGVQQLSSALTLEVGIHGVNLFSLPFPPPWYICYANGSSIIPFVNSAGTPTTRVSNGYDLVKAINRVAGGDVVSTFGRWIGPYAVDMKGIIIETEPPNNPEAVKEELVGIPLINGGSYQAYIVGAPNTRVTLVIKNTAP